MKKEVFNSCQGGGEQEILGVFSLQGLACNYFTVCRFIRTGVCFQSREKGEQTGICNRSATVRNQFFLF